MSIMINILGGRFVQKNLWRNSWPYTDFIKNHEWSFVSKGPFTPTESGLENEHLSLIFVSVRSEYEIEFSMNPSGSDVAFAFDPI